MITVPFRVIAIWRKWRSDWETLCNGCGKCCYSRYVGKDGELNIQYNRPCEFLDTKTHLCTVYEERFKKCDHCGKVNLWVALFNRALPKDCPYATTFRIWND